MSWVAVAVGGATLVNGIMQRDAAGDAADAQVQASNDANKTQLEMFNRNKADLAPWMQGGGQGWQALLKYLGVGPNGMDPNAPGVRPFGMADFQADPGYQFRLNEGENAILNKRSALGGVNSGGTLRDLATYGQGMASQEYGNAYARYNNNINNIYSRLSGLSNTGVNAAGNVAGLGANAANQISANQLGAGNAQAAGIVGQSNATTGSIGGLMNNWLLSNALQQNQTSGNAIAKPLGGSGAFFPFNPES
jgi:hypothetical protein